VVSQIVLTLHESEVICTSYINLRAFYRDDVSGVSKINILIC